MRTQAILVIALLVSAGCEQVLGIEDPGGGGPQINCTGSLQDNFEPNDSVSAAYQTDVAAKTTHSLLQPLAICPGTDKDVFTVDIIATGQALDVTVMYGFGLAPLQAVLLNPDGTPIANSGPEGMDVETIHATNLPAGMVFVQVSNTPAGGPNQGTNTYSLDLLVRGP